MEVLDNHPVGLLIWELHEPDQPLERKPDLSLDNGLIRALVNQPVILLLQNPDQKPRNILTSNLKLKRLTPLLKGPNRINILVDRDELVEFLNWLLQKEEQFLLDIVLALGTRDFQRDNLDKAAQGGLPVHVGADERDDAFDCPWEEDVVDRDPW